MSFERIYITNAGSLLSAKTLQGKCVEFDHVEIGTGTITSGTEAEREALVNKVLECNINSIRIVNNKQVRVQFLFSNQSLNESIYFRELGLFAIDPDTIEYSLTEDIEVDLTKTYYIRSGNVGAYVYTEVTDPVLADIGTYYERSYDLVLYAYANAGENAEYITNSSTSLITKNIRINAGIDNAENVTINVDPTQAYVTQEDFNDAMDDIDVALAGKASQTDLSNFEDEVNQKISTVYKYKGSVNNYSSLPSSNLTVGDTYNIVNADSAHGIKAGDNVAWTGSTWDVLAGTVDLSDYLLATDAASTYVSKTSIAPTSITLETTDFTLDSTENLYKAVISDNRITTTSMVIIDPLRASRSVVDDAKFEPDVDVATGTATIWCTNQPTASIALQYTVIGGN